MNRSLFVLGTLMIIGLAGCQTRTKTMDHPVITVSIQPQKYFVEQLIGDRIGINVMIPPGVGHGTFDPTPRQIRDLESSLGYLQIGYLGFEQVWLPRIRKNHPDLTITDLSIGIEPITVEDGEHAHDNHEVDTGHRHEGTDPHTWLSPKSARIIARNTATALITADPSCSQMVEENLVLLLGKIDQLDTLFTLSLAELRVRSFIIFHPALTYLARDYGLVQIPMEQGGKEPTAAHLKRLVDAAASEGIKTIFVQKEYDQENALTLSRELKGRIIQIDPLAEDWYDEMLRILKALTNDE